MAEPTKDDVALAQWLMDVRVGFARQINAGDIAQAIADFRVRTAAGALAESVVCDLDQEGVLRRPMGASCRADEGVRGAARHIIAKALIAEREDAEEDR